MPDRYLEHRRRLAEIVGPDGLAIIPAASEVIRNFDVTHPFHQDTAFWYVSGFGEPDAVAVIAPGHDEGDYALFVRPRDPEQEIWTGLRSGVEGAKRDHGADAAYEIGELDDVLQRYMVGREVLWYAPGKGAFDDRVTRLIERARSLRERHGYTLPSTIRDVSVPLGEMMLFKSDGELESLRRACELSVDGHLEAMRFTRPGAYEYEVQAALEYHWRLGGSRHNGYPSIVASGPNACILHYVENDRRIGQADLVLVDAGAEVDGYSADITRTFPASGSFTPEQRAVYEVVLSAEKKGVELATPGSTLGEIHDAVVRILTEGMVDLGLLPGTVDDSVAMAHYRAFYMHGTSHWLGLDVHDRGSYRIENRHRALEPGMTFTVEPGLYVGPDKAQIELSLLEIDPDARAERRIRLGTKAATALEKEEEDGAEKITHDLPASLLGLGVRIEDDVLITLNGHENLTARAPVEIEEVETIGAEGSSLPRSW